MPELSVLVGSGHSKLINDCFPEGTVITPGDTKIIWDKNSAAECEAAKSTFDKLLAKGYVAFRAEGEKGDKGSQIKTWEPAAERIIMIPKIQGGRR